MQKTDNILEIYYDGVHQRLNAEIDHITRVIGHTGEIGRANEELLVDLITKFLPKQYGIGSGIIIDSEGNRSNQVDIILYDSQRHPEMFAQSSTYLFPVDVVYMTIEVKTTMNTQHMKHALDNIASVKQLKYIKSAIYSSHTTENNEMNIMMSRTTPPIGIIFGYRCETDDFDTYSSWLRLTQGMPEQQFFDLAYNVETTFSHGYQNWVDKKEFSQGIYYLHQFDITGEGAYDKRYYSPKDGKGYPVIKKGPKKYVVDPARGLLMFLVNIHSILLTKHIIQTSIMDKYLKGELTHALPFD